MDLTNITQEQREYILFDQKQDTKLIATAGSGKTFCIIQHMKYILHKKLYPGDQVYMLTFSRNARDDFLQKMRKYGVTEVPAENVHTIDSFAWSILGSDIAKSIDVSILSYAMLVILRGLDGENDDIYRIHEKTPEHFFAKLQTIKCIFVDEAQDLNDIQYQILVLLKKHCRANLHLIGDPNQNIYQFRKSCDKYLLHYPAHTFHLSKNFRSQKHIVEFCSHLRPYATLPVCFTQEAPEYAPSNLKVTFYPYENTHSFEHYLLSILHHFIAKNIPLHKVTILAPTRGYLRCTNGLRNYKGLCYIANLLFKNEIAFQQFYNDMGSDISFVPHSSAAAPDTSAAPSCAADVSQGCGKINYRVKKNHINLMTCTASKGLEWDYVIIVDANAFLISPRHHYDQEKYLAEQYLLYVACSRPRKNLIIFSKQKCVNPWFERVPLDFYKLSPNRPDNQKLIFYDTSKLFKSPVTGQDGNSADATMPRTFLKTKVSALGEQTLYTIYTILKPLLIKKEDTPMCENASQWKCKVPDHKKTLLAKFLEYLFYILSFQDALEDTAYLKDVSNIAYAQNIIFCDQEHVIFWYFAHRDQLSWEQYDQQKDKMSPHIRTFIENKFDRALPFHIYTLVDVFFDTFILKNRDRIRACYEQHRAYPYHIRNVLFLTLISHALRTTHYFYINLFESFYDDIVKKNKTFFLLLDTYCRVHCVHKIHKFKHKIEYPVASLVTELDFVLEREKTEEPCKLISTSGQATLKDIIYMVLTTYMWQPSHACTFHTICIPKGVTTSWTYKMYPEIFQTVLHHVLSSSTH